MASKACDPRCCTVAQSKGFQRALLVLLASGQRFCRKVASYILAGTSLNQKKYNFDCEEKRALPHPTAAPMPMPIVLCWGRRRVSCRCWTRGAPWGLQIQGWRHWQAQFRTRTMCKIWWSWKDKCLEGAPQPWRSVQGVLSNTDPNPNHLFNKNVTTRTWSKPPVTHSLVRPSYRRQTSISLCIDPSSYTAQHLAKFGAQPIHQQANAWPGHPPLPSSDLPMTSIAFASASGCCKNPFVYTSCIAPNAALLTSQ